MTDLTDCELRVALIQRGPATGRPAADLAENLRLIDEAARGRPDFIVLNELSTVPYFPRNPAVDHRAWALPLTDAHLAAVDQRARRSGSCIVYPFYELLPSGRCSNSVVVFGPDGPVQGTLPDGRTTPRSAKVHLAQTPKTGVDEHLFFSPGDGFPVFDTPKARIGALVCYDRRFPEGWRVLSLDGAQVVFMVADVPAWAPSPDATAEEMFQLELRTRALENLFFVAACNKAGVEELGDVTTRFFGRSCVIDPYGAVLAEAPADVPMILEASIPLERIAAARHDLPYFDERRPELYGRIAADISEATTAERR